VRRLLHVTWLVLALSVGNVQAQPAAADANAELLVSRWSAILTEVLAERGLRLVDAAGQPVPPGAAAVRVDAPPDVVREAYVEAIRRLLLDSRLEPFFRTDLSLIDERSERSDQEWVARLAAEVPREKGAKSNNATLTNAAAPQGAERSGFSDLVSLALVAKNFVAANESAVTINLNAIALVGLNSSTRSAQALYREHGALRRIGGSFTFGAKIPQGEITGLTGLPSADDLLDAIGWDVNYRVYGDRDPRAMRWYGLMLGYLGGVVEVSANLLASIPADDRTLVKGLLSDQVGAALSAVKTRLQKSAQVTFKAGGQHLTKETGKNKYTFALLADKGFGDTDLTANASYSVVDDVRIQPGRLHTLKTWSVAVAVNHLVGKDLIVAGRAIELSLDGRVDVPVDTGGLPIERENVWRVVGSVSLPWGDAATIPVSITYASDPNSVTKEKFFTGHIGVSYDFGALKSLFQPKDARK
jgi:hypothetical protein